MVTQKFHCTYDNNDFIDCCTNTDNEIVISIKEYNKTCEIVLDIQTAVKFSKEIRRKIAEAKEKEVGNA